MATAEGETSVTVEGPRPGVAIVKYLLKYPLSGPSLRVPENALQRLPDCHVSGNWVGSLGRYLGTLGTSVSRYLGTQILSTLQGLLDMAGAALAITAVPLSAVRP